MIGEKVSRLRQHSESGQTLVLVPLLLVVLLIMGALVLDLGNVYVCYQQLQSTPAPRPWREGPRFLRARPQLP